MAFKFSWKKTAVKDIKSRSAFQGNVDDYEDESLEKVDWQTLLPKHKELSQEKPNDQSERLYKEGIVLAEEERYWEAINRWEQALKITPSNEKLHEMKSQVLMELSEIHPAVQSAEKAVQMKPNWAEALQTLGRSQLNIGEIQMALKSFIRAKHLMPNTPELWDEDIKWTIDLIETRKQQEIMPAASSDSEEMDLS